MSTRPRETPSSSRIHAFTLVELLVVIGIIGVLIAILLPALSAARRQASTTKCAAALRELGSCFQMYAVDYKGYFPPVQLRTASGVTYSIENTTYPVQGSGSELVYPYWFNFIGKYVTKGKIGGEATDVISISEIKNRSIIWGCPEWQGIFSGTSFGGINRVMTGYGMNIWPTFMPDHPKPPDPYPEGIRYTPQSRERNLLINFGSNGVTGDFQKSTTYGRMGAQRILLADSKSWAAESGRLPPNVTIPAQAYGESFVTYTQTSTARTMIDFYRHGKLPKVFPGTPAVYANTGGKVQFNVLWADGHVSLATDKETAWKGLRMRFPE